MKKFIVIFFAAAAVLTSCTQQQVVNPYGDLGPNDGLVLARPASNTGIPVDNGDMRYNAYQDRSAWCDVGLMPSIQIAFNNARNSDPVIVTVESNPLTVTRETPDPYRPGYTITVTEVYPWKITSVRNVIR